MKTLSKRVTLDQAIKKHILDSINNTGYGGGILTTDKEKLAFVYNCFNSEYSWAIKQYGQQEAFKQWLQGLPSSLTVYFSNYDILQFALSTGYYGERMTERQEEQVINNWFNIVAVKAFQLFRKYKIA